MSSAICPCRLSSPLCEKTISMPLETTTHYNQDIINKAALIFCKKYFTRPFILCFFGVLLALTLIFLLDSKTWISGTLLSISLLGCMIFVLSFFIYRKHSLTTYRAMESPTVKWSFTQECIISESDIGCHP